MNALAIHDHGGRHAGDNGRNSGGSKAQLKLVQEPCGQVEEGQGAPAHASVETVGSYLARLGAGSPCPLCGEPLQERRGQSSDVVLSCPECAAEMVALVGS